MKRKTIALLLVGAMALGVAGCSKEDRKKSSKKDRDSKKDSEIDVDVDSTDGDSDDDDADDDNPISGVIDDIDNDGFDEPVFTENDAGAFYEKEIPADQLDCIMNNRDVWEIEFSNGYDEYAVVDLDHDGLYEVLTDTTGGSGFFTYAGLYEVNADLSGMTMVAYWDPELVEDTDFYPEIDFFSEMYPVYVLGDGTYLYTVSNTIRGGMYGSSTYNYYLYFMPSGEVKMDLVSVYSIVHEEANDAGVITYYDGNNIEITESEYLLSMDPIARLSGVARVGDLSIRWFVTGQDPLSSFDDEDIRFNLEISANETHLE